MKRLFTIDDIIDVYAKLNQRGLRFITSKFNFNEVKRAKTAFNHKEIQSSNWWIIPMVRERWNSMVTGDKSKEFVDFTVNTFLKDKKSLKMLSLGSGNCASELKFASYNNFDEIVCSDISEILLRNAEEVAENKQLENIKFQVHDANTFSFPKRYYDIVYFRASLHHFKNIDELIGKLVKETLKHDGLLIIDEYVGPNRVQFPNHQIKAINKAIQLIPKKYRKRFKLNFHKNKVSGSGIIRMKIADPSECIESEKILPAIHQHYKTIYEANYGGNILMTAIKDIAHHFITLDSEKEQILNQLFEFEDLYLEKHPSDFVFGIYKKL
jgi:ubiquinone/menaquinone biosynthesis C-methylase UbiE